MVDELNPQVLSEWLTGMSLPESSVSEWNCSLPHDMRTREFEAATEPFKDPFIIIEKLIGLSELQHQLSAQIGPLYGWRRD